MYKFTLTTKYYFINKVFKNKNNAICPHLATDLIIYINNDFLSLLLVNRKYALSSRT
jgi:hypothetical protein